MGHVFTDTGLSVSDKKVDAIRRMPDPTNRQAVLSFLDMATYLARHIPGFSEMTAPLRDLLKRDYESAGTAQFTVKPSRKSRTLCQKHLYCVTMTSTSPRPYSVTVLSPDWAPRSCRRATQSSLPPEHSLRLNSLRVN